MYELKNLAVSIIEDVLPYLEKPIRMQVPMSAESLSLIGDDKFYLLCGLGTFATGLTWASSEVIPTSVQSIRNPFKGRILDCIKVPLFAKNEWAWLSESYMRLLAEKLDEYF